MLRSTFVLLCLSTGFGLPSAMWGQSEGPLKPPSESVSRPRKKEAQPEPELDKIPSKLTKKSESPADATFSTEATSVTVDVAVLTQKGQFIPGIGRQYFRVYEDNVPQQIKSFNLGEAPLTVCMLIEFSNKFQSIYGSGWYQTLQAAYGFVQTLKPEDYVAIIAYDLRPEILSDFTTDRRQTEAAMSRLRVAGFSEANMFDALSETLDRMGDIEGRKAVILISSGIDTFSKLTFDKTRKLVQSAGIPIYSIGLLQTARELADARGSLGAIERLDFLQADNTLRTFSKETGGQSFFPRFYGEFPSIYQSISQGLRNQYSLTYSPSNQARDGKFRRIRVELIDPATNQQIVVKDEKQRPLKYTIIAKQGYKAPRAVE